MTYKERVEAVPSAIRDDPVWRVEACRLALFASDLAWHERLGSKTRAVRLMPDPEVRRVGIDRSTWRMVHHRAWFEYELRSGFALLVGKSETRHQRGDIQIAVRHR